MAFTQDQLEALEEAIVSGQLIVKFNGREITYRSSDDLMKTYRYVKDQLDTLTRNPASVASFT